ncbi:hypothetical protein RRG08_053314 [Elysia crispata]|uniref:Uncharacterized protein n=1 Tax=Elysia crispata TaxID=231223 RepID=A0AAE1AFX2_9GAST|nr:hypothetical protein RRG08_053314 [Elysia crispata]
MYTQTQPIQECEAKQVNDSRFVGISIYNVVTRNQNNQENAPFDFTSLAIVLCSILSMGLMIIPETAQQFTEPLDRMLNTPDISLITSQANLRTLWPMMLSELWPLPSQMQLLRMYEEEKPLPGQ